MKRPTSYLAPPLPPLTRPLYQCKGRPTERRNNQREVRMVNISDVIAERGRELNKMTAIRRGPLPINTFQ